MPTGFVLCLTFLRREGVMFEVVELLDDLEGSYTERVRYRSGYESLATRVFCGLRNAARNPVWLRQDGEVLAGSPLRHA